MDGIVCNPSSLVMFVCMAHLTSIVMNVSELKFQTCAIRVSISRLHFS